tara:strand:- start:261 stop:671 length:411 start_codon:yes stop_codon:yes gene_type:complete
MKNEMINMISSIIRKLKEKKLKTRAAKYIRPNAERSEINYIKAFEDLVNSAKSRLSICPESSVRYIENGGFIISLNGRRIRIMNGVLGYESTLTDKQETYLVNLFNRREARRCARLDGIIDNKLEKSLSNILKIEE